MNVLVIGTGYVGTTTGLVLCEKGHKVTGLDIDEKKVEALSAGRLHFYEKGLPELLRKHLNQNNISFTTDVKTAIQQNDFIFICVGTPKKKDGSADLSAVYSVAKMIGTYMNKYKVVINKSTVPVGTASKVKEVIEAENGKVPFDVVSNPEFLREGSAVYDALHPDRVVIGSSSKKALEMMRQLYVSETSPIVETTPNAAELIKYASNSFLALKISFINQLARLCDMMQVDIDEISKGIGLDHRIGPHFLKAGIGYGGSCFPKDVSALITIAKEEGMILSILEEVEEINKSQPFYFLEKVEKHIGGLEGKSIAVLGVAFKPGTDDTRESPSLVVIDELVSKGCSVNVHDPIVTITNPSVKQFDHVFDAVDGVDAIVLITDWDEYLNLDWQKVKSTVNRPYIFDGRNALNKQELVNIGFHYEGIGKP
ncbi:UDP-glucose/GDP-mannose dehydrogenase family protein [Fredinandcohnia sp. QZ13]|uniref:UDP-glucose dehydrogenase family protein n=1 Tax=Fredinandcohnia sp. QZ13 TaxID=3073144 RepID=UPI00285359DF|nr:UDP-glucose/GDP-mannose dehydrogenase family protein [Fredinandcohnia sp. QZ13]MDR4886988.1 UDP-glucose/GDP-mannose dehydrogenase family protein [Fredinandcohnia sp. QZ13]